MMIKRNGFTLIEIILYVGIMVTFITGVVSFALGIINSRQKSSVQQSVIYATRHAARRINYEVRNASAINTVSASSLSLASVDPARNPTLIDLSGGRIRIGYGAAGSCPTSAPCYLTPDDVVIQSLEFVDLSDVGNLTANVRFEIAAKTAGGGGGSLNWFYKYYATGSAEVRSK